MSPHSRTSSKKKSKISLSEFIAGLALLAKILEQAGKLSGRAEVESFVTIAGFLSISLLFFSIVLWLHSSTRRLEKVDLIAERLDKIKEELEQLDRMARYGSTGAMVNRLYGLQDKLNIRPHCQAGGLTFSPLIFDDFPKAVKDFYKLNRGEETELKIKDQHIVDNFLLHLITQLPKGSNWFGISRLQSPAAWGRQTANVAYFEFQNAVEKRTKDREINYFRLLLFDDDAHRESMEPILHQQEISEMHLRYIVGGSSMDDISIIWVPVHDLARADTVKDLDSPIDELAANTNTFQPLCGIKFQTRGGRELDEMTIYSPETIEFKDMRLQFRTRWKNAKALSQAREETTQR